MNKILVCLALAAGALATPALSFAQSNPAPITRAEVRADLVRVEQAGYTPSAGDNATYPADVQAAEAKVAGQADQQQVNTAVGGASQTGTSASGTRSGVALHPGCVGPVSFCNVYFGS